MGYDMSTVDQGSYFRLNIWGMQRCREYMWALGLAVASEFPTWPDPKEFGFDSHEELWAAQEASEQGRAEPDGDARLTRYEEAMEKARRAHGSDDPGFPLHKVGSNDGCVVTPDELRDVLKIYDDLLTTPEGRAKIQNAVAADDQEWWDEWIAYLRKAVDEGGVAVY